MRRLLLSFILQILAPIVILVAAISVIVDAFFYLLNVGKMYAAIFIMAIFCGLCVLMVRGANNDKD